MNFVSAWQIVNAAPLTPRANGCRAGGEPESLQWRRPSNRITEVTIGELNTPNASSNLAALTIFPALGIDRTPFNANVAVTAGAGFI